jgi:hypothetical protein
MKPGTISLPRRRGRTAVTPLYLSSQAAQHESLDSARVNACEASFRPSDIARNGAHVFARSSTVSPNFTAYTAARITSPAFHSPAETIDQVVTSILQISPPRVTTYAVFPMISSDVG